MAKSNSQLRIRETYCFTQGKSQGTFRHSSKIWPNPISLHVVTWLHLRASSQTGFLYMITEGPQRLQTSHFAAEHSVSFLGYSQKVSLHLIASDRSRAYPWTIQCIKGNVTYALIASDLVHVLHRRSLSSGRRPGLVQQQGARAW